MRNGYCRCGPFKVNMMPQGILKPFILKLLNEKPRHGFEIMEEIFNRSDSIWKPSAAAIYPALMSLKRQGFIERVNDKENFEKARKEYRITETGKKALADYNSFKKDWSENIDKLKDIWD